MVDDIAILGFLISGPRHGYEIYQRFTELPGLWEIWRIKQGRLYAMLNRLESRGLVQAETRYQENRPARKVYRITGDGITAYHAWVVRPVENGRKFRLDFLVKLFFALQEGPDEKDRLVQSQIETCQGWLADEQGALEALDDRQPFERAVHDFRIGQISAMLAWLSSVSAMEFFDVQA